MGGRGDVIPPFPKADSGLDPPTKTKRPPPYNAKNFPELLRILDRVLGGIYIPPFKTSKYIHIRTHVGTSGGGEQIKFKTSMTVNLKVQSREPRSYITIFHVQPHTSADMWIPATAPHR